MKAASQSVLKVDLICLTAPRRFFDGEVP